MSTDRPERLSDRIAELWNDRPRSDRRAERLSVDHSLDQASDSPVAAISPNRPSDDRPLPDRPVPDRFSDHPADRFTNREFARFSDLEPLTPVSAPSASAIPFSSPSAPSPGPFSNSGPNPVSNSGPTPVPAPSRASSDTSDPAPTRVRPWAPQPYEPTPRAVGSPLPTGSAPTGSALTGSALSTTPAAPAQPPSSRATSPAHHDKSLALGRGLPPAEAPPMELPSGVQRAVNAIRATLPFIQRILPLLDGNIGTAVSNLMAPPALPHPRPAPPPPPVDLAPLEEGISSLQTQQRELRTQIADQNSSLKRVEDQLEMVREATDRNTLEQQELLEDLKGIGNKVNIFAMVALLLLVVSVMVNVILYLHIKRVLP